MYLQLVHPYFLLSCSCVSCRSICVFMFSEAVGPETIELDDTLPPFIKWSCCPAISPPTRSPQSINPYSTIKRKKHACIKEEISAPCVRNVFLRRNSFGKCVLRYGGKRGSDFSFLFSTGSRKEEKMRTMMEKGFQRHKTKNGSLGGSSKRTNREKNHETRRSSTGRRKQFNWKRGGIKDEENESIEREKD